MGSFTVATASLSIHTVMADKWQQVLDLIASLIKVPAALIMRVEPPSIKVFLSSHSDGNPYEEHELAPLNTGLYCETVMARRGQLLVPNALADPAWCSNPDIKLGMISYLGLPLVWPDEHVFGTICVLDRKENAYSELHMRVLEQFRSVVERDLRQVFQREQRAHEDAQLRAEEAERVRAEFAVLRAGEQRALQQLQQLNNHLEERVAERTVELKKAMEQIIVAEKMATVGRLVTGIAHELNTPLGNMMLGATSLADRFDTVYRQASEQRLTQASLRQLLDDGRQACALIERNGSRAGDLIASFKQVAVDQDCQERRLFMLNETIENLLRALGPAIRQGKLQLEATVPPGLQMDSYPGHIEQILAKLVSNSIVHAFAGREDRRARISASLRGDAVELVYEDNGQGIDPVIQPRVFDPFFTTRVGEGAQGLGLSVVLNAVQAILKGSVRLDSRLGEGVRFTFLLPLSLPEQ
ncbi:MAG TPA: GAF domain-containing sensor histidine kinase [Pseudoduganella sp.]